MISYYPSGEVLFLIVLDMVCFSIFIRRKIANCFFFLRRKFWWGRFFARLCYSMSTCRRCIVFTTQVYSHISTALVMSSVKQFFARNEHIEFNSTTWTVSWKPAIWVSVASSRKITSLIHSQSLPVDILYWNFPRNWCTTKVKVTREVSHGGKFHDGLAQKNFCMAESELIAGELQ